MQTNSPWTAEDAHVWGEERWTVRDALVKLAHDPEALGGEPCPLRLNGAAIDDPANADREAGPFVSREDLDELWDEVANMRIGQRNNTVMGVHEGPWALIGRHSPTLGRTGNRVIAKEFPDTLQAAQVATPEPVAGERTHRTPDAEYAEHYRRQFHPREHLITCWDIVKLLALWGEAMREELAQFRGLGYFSHGPLSHQVPISIQMCSKTAIIVCIYEHVEIEIGA